MHHGVHIGDRVNQFEPRVLILGESHHTNDGENNTPGVPATYDTADVVKRYLENYSSEKDRDPAYRFFDNIVSAFGFVPNLDREAFWKTVYFGNYIDVLCGVRDSAATKVLAKPGKRENLNNQLFSFVEQNQIDIIFCFSRRVYNKLPPLEDRDTMIPADTSDSHRLEVCTYRAGERKYGTVSLSKDLTVYGLKHPSQGFSYHKYASKLKEILQKERRKNYAY